MTSDRRTRRIERLLDEIDQAEESKDWASVEKLSRTVLDIDPENHEATTYLNAAERFLADDPTAELGKDREPVAPLPSAPTSFVNGRYEVKRFLGEGGKKKVYLAHDTTLGRDVAFALIKSEGLDNAGRERIQREAQAMGRLGTHPHIVTVFDLGEESGQPYMVTELMGGGDVEGVLEDAESNRLSIEDAVRIASEVAEGLEFAHSNGIVHRDLKPGNVWLTADGTAKIGDFGLAVSTDRSRLTQEGMMVGTVSYMPPEQALGGDVTPQADLYSLGAMLYEMVAGRVPFVGDDAIAVISQHINTSPVAPSWHNAECPPDIEDLVMRLLEKNIDQRPNSAADVRTALDNADLNKRGASHSEAGENPLDRLARGVFVGRENELERLRSAFSQAMSGRGSVVMIVGEPGIGKTRTTQELETYARMRGAQTLWGRAHEAAGMPAYWPWIQVGRAYGASSDLREIESEIRAVGADLLRLFPPLRDTFPDLPEPEPITDEASAQFRLFDAYTTFLRAASARTPLVVVLDDIHWADRASLQMLEHVGRELAHMRVLVVGTYRDTELARTHPLSQSLAELNRGEGFQRISLRGLTRGETAGYIDAVAGVTPRPRVLNRIFEETEGNPFFLQEVVSLMTEEGSLTKESVSDVSIPEGVREALGRRLDRLSEEANEMLTFAAIVGREFTFDTLTLLGNEENALLLRIEEGLKARVIEEMDAPGRYRFTHALMQETLLSELSTTRRVRMHGQVAEALEGQWGQRADERASRLAVHFMESATLSQAHVVKAVHYAKLAAEQAETVMAWDEAARRYGACIELIDSAADTDLGQDLAALLVAYGRCQQIAGDQRPGWRALMRARDFYRERGDGLGLGSVALAVANYLAPRDRQRAAIREALSVLPENEPVLEARLLALNVSSRVNPSGIDNPDREAQIKRAEMLAQEHDLPDVRGELLFTRGMIDRPEPDNGAGLIKSAHEEFVRAGRSFQAGMAIMQVGGAVKSTGDVTAAEERFREAIEYNAKVHAMTSLRGSYVGLGCILLIQCRFEEFQEHLEEMREIPGNEIYVGQLESSWRELTGDAEGALNSLATEKETGNVDLYLSQVHGNRARVAYNAGDIDMAMRELNLWAPTGGGFPNLIDDCLAEMGGEGLVRREYQVLQGLEFGSGGVHSKGRRFSGLSEFSHDRQRGRYALRLGLISEAEGHLKDAWEVLERENCPVELGRTELVLAEIADQRGDRAGASRLVDQAVERFQQNGAQLYLRQALSKKEILKA